MLLFGLDIVAALAGLWLATRLRTSLPFGLAILEEAAAPPWQVYAAASAIWVVTMAVNGVYSPLRITHWRDELVRVAWSSLVAIVVLAGFLYLTFRQVSRLQMGYFLVITSALLLGYRIALRAYFRKARSLELAGRRRVAIVGGGELGTRVGQIVQDLGLWGVDLAGYLDGESARVGEDRSTLQALGDIDRVRDVVQSENIDELWVALPPREYDLLDWLTKELEDLPIRVMVIPDYSSLALIRQRPDIIGGVPIIGLKEPVIEGVPLFIKRTFDLILASLLLLLTLPVQTVIAIAIRLDSPGPVVFKVERVGESQAIFEMYKFRTMVKDAMHRQSEVISTTENKELVHKQPDDPRVTRVGKVLRRWSLDELPQMINVLRGDMSLVGPRPEMPWLVDRYQSWQRKRFAVPQGITGWWQINGRSDRPMHLNTEDDLYYIYNYSLFLDLIILLRTPIAVIRGRGAF
ncbi:MAG: sugar transferase [Anaerolineales bacterium]